MSENTERCVCCAGPGPCITVDRNQGKTPSPLTREQVEEQLENIHLGSVGVRVKSMACIRKHDAALRLTIAQQAQRIQELEDQRIRYGPICLNCGKDKPCMTEAEANQHGASIPCIFDPAPKELWQRCEQQAQEIERLKGELGLKEEWAHLHADDVLRLKQQLADLTRERDSIGSGLEEANLCIRQLEQQVARLRECLVMAKCPTCDGSGWYHDTDSLTGEPVQAQCRWCVEQRALRETGA